DATYALRCTRRREKRRSGGRKVIQVEGFPKRICGLLLRTVPTNFRRRAAKARDSLRLLLRGRSSHPACLYYRPAFLPARPCAPAARATGWSAESRDIRYAGRV